MDYEKKYKEALERAIFVKENTDSIGARDVSDVIEYIFSELKEAEDEKIRKALVHLINEQDGFLTEINGISVKDIIAWLEKQGKSKFEQCLQEGDKIVTNEDGTHFNVSQLERVAKKEPKFKVGNWYQCTKDFFGKGVTFDKNTAYYCAKEGCLQCEYGCHIAIVKDLYDNFKLWDISDAKDGDVLLSSSTPEGDKECPFIFKEIDKSGIVRFHAALLQSEELVIDDGITNVMGYVNAGYHIPATKEQRDLLFQKMKEAGYEWDAEKKELKIIDWSKHIKYEPNGPSTTKENTAWSEEDENMIARCIDIFEKILKSSYVYAYTKDCLSWLKSLQDRVKPQWKPSEEQIHALEYQVHSTYKGSWQYKASNELLEQLKKL